MDQAPDVANVVSVALWAANYGFAFPTEDSWVAVAEEQIRRAAAKGASILVMPEWLSEQWSGLGPHQGSEGFERLKWEAETADRLLPQLGRIVAEEGIALLAGTTPALTKDGNGWTNRARLYLPDGQTLFQDKIFFTPSEKSLPGGREADSLTIVDWNGIRIGMAICLDSESPIISTQLRAASIDLLLTPSLTSTISGYNRVSSCTKARAVELMCPVATVGSIGIQKNPNGVQLNNVSGASVFVPCEMEFANGSGVWSSTGVIDNATLSGPGILHIVADVPIGRCAALRASGAEAWSRHHMDRAVPTSAAPLQTLLPAAGIKTEKNLAQPR